MSGRFSIGTHSGNVRAHSEDGRTLTLIFFDPKKPGAPYREWEGPVLLSDLREIVSYYDEIEARNPSEQVIAELEADPALAQRLTRLIIQQMMRDSKIRDRERP